MEKVCGRAMQRGREYRYTFKYIYTSQAMNTHVCRVYDYAHYMYMYNANIKRKHHAAWHASIRSTNFYDKITVKSFICIR